MGNLLEIVNRFEVTDFAVSEKDRKYLDAVNVKVKASLIDEVAAELGEEHEVVQQLRDTHAASKITFNIIPLAVVAGATHYTLVNGFFVSDSESDPGWGLLA